MNINNEYIRTIRKIYNHNPNVIFGGSFSLMLQGAIDRNVNDIDVVECGFKSYKDTRNYPPESINKLFKSMHQDTTLYPADYKYKKYDMIKSPAFIVLYNLFLKGSEDTWADNKVIKRNIKVDVFNCVIDVKDYTEYIVMDVFGMKLKINTIAEIFRAKEHYLSKFKGGDIPSGLRKHQIDMDYHRKLKLIMIKGL